MRSPTKRTMSLASQRPGHRLVDERESRRDRREVREVRGGHTATTPGASSARRRVHRQEPAVRDLGAHEGHVQRPGEPFVGQVVGVDRSSGEEPRVLCADHPRAEDAHAPAFRHAGCAHSTRGCDGRTGASRSSGRRAWSGPARPADRRVPGGPWASRTTAVSPGVLACRQLVLLASADAPGGVARWPVGGAPSTSSRSGLRVAASHATVIAASVVPSSWSGPVDRRRWRPTRRAADATEASRAWDPSRCRVTNH